MTIKIFAAWFTVAIYCLSLSPHIAQAGLVYCDDATHTVTNSQFVYSGTSDTLGFDDSHDGTVYFKTVINPTSDFNDENYFAGIEFYTGFENTFSLGNNFGSPAWSTYGTIGEHDLNSADSEPGEQRQLVDSSDGDMNIVYKIDYTAGGDDKITVWLNPLNGTEADQSASSMTMFTGDFSFDAIQARAGESDDTSWSFNEFKIATEFGDLVNVPEPSTYCTFALALGFLFRRRRSPSNV